MKLKKCNNPECKTNKNENLEKTYTLKENCPECREKLELSQEDKNYFRAEKIDYIYQAKGCSSCNDGYLGRTAAAEILLINSKLQKLINQQADYSRFKKEALASGMLTLANAALKKMKEGITSREEILRVIELKPELGGDNHF